MNATKTTMDSNLRSIVERALNKKIVVVGDTIVDHYVYGTVIGTSAETPTLVARELHQRFSLGGAFLVCRNLLELGATVDFITLAGTDSDADEIKRFSHPRLTMHLFQESERQTTVKRRFWVDDYKLLQFDKLDNRPIGQGLEQEIMAIINGLSFSALILSDYRHGLLTEGLIKQLISKQPCFVDSQVSQSASNHHLYRGATCFCLNLKEAKLIEKTAHLATLSRKLDALNIFVKKGEEGADAWLNGTEVSAAGYRVNPVDTCGAGDAFLAALAVCGLDNPQEALYFANRWAAFSTTVKGPQPPSLQSFLEGL